MKDLKSQTGQKANPEICNRKNPLRNDEPEARLTRQKLAPRWDRPTGTGTGKETERGSHCGFFFHVALHPVSHHCFHLPQPSGEPADTGAWKAQLIYLGLQLPQLLPPSSRMVPSGLETVEAPS